MLGLLFSIKSHSSAEPEWVPVYEEPRHRLVFENDDAYILDVNLPPGYTSLYHQHVIDVLYVTIGGTTVWAEPMGGNRREATVKRGDLRFSSDNHPLPHIHRVGNIGQTPFHVIGVGRKSATLGNAVTLEGDTSNMDMVMEKDHASVYRIVLDPGEKSGLHRHLLPYTRVYMSNGQLLDSEGITEEVSAGEFQWEQSSDMHSYENTGDAPIEIIEMQWR